MDRKSGVLMHISSLPGDYSIGSFGEMDKRHEKNNCKIVLEKENEVVYSCLGLLPQNIEEMKQIAEKLSMTTNYLANVITQPPTIYFHASRLSRKKKAARRLLASATFTQHYRIT